MNPLVILFNAWLRTQAQYVDERQTLLNAAAAIFAQSVKDPPEARIPLSAAVITY